MRKLREFGHGMGRDGRVGRKERNTREEEYAESSLELQGNLPAQGLETSLSRTSAISFMRFTRHIYSRPSSSPL